MQHVDLLSLLFSHTQSAFHDGKQPNWFHETCFFAKQRPATTGDIENFGSLRMEDQKRIAEQVSQSSSVVAQPSASNGAKSKSKKRPADTIAKMTDVASKDFGIEYAVSARAECRGCEIKIPKGEVRIKKIDYNSEVGMKYGGQAMWHHYECFAKVSPKILTYSFECCSVLCMQNVNFVVQ